LSEEEDVLNIKESLVREEELEFLIKVEGDGDEFKELLLYIVNQLQ
jgi:hypothetical protein